MLDNASGVRRLLSRLTAHNLIIAIESDNGRTFVQHSIIQAFYYESIGKRSRWAMHHRAAKYYEQNPAGTLQAVRHYQLADQWDHAAQLATNDIWSIINAGQAHTLQATLDKFDARQLGHLQWVVVLLARGDVAALLGTAPLAGQLYQEALAHIQTLPDEPAVREQFARACCRMGALLEYEAPQEALTWLEQGLSQAADVSDRLAAALYIKMGTVQIPLETMSRRRRRSHTPRCSCPMGQASCASARCTRLARSIVPRAQSLVVWNTRAKGLEICAQLNDYVRMAKMLSNLAIDKLISADMSGALADFQRAGACRTDRQRELAPGGGAQCGCGLCPPGR